MQCNTANFQADVDGKIRGVFYTWGAHPLTNNGDPGACALLIVQSQGGPALQGQGKICHTQESCPRTRIHMAEHWPHLRLPHGDTPFHTWWRPRIPWDHWTRNPSPVQLWFSTSITANARNLQDWVQARSVIEIHLCAAFFFFFLN